MKRLARRFRYLKWKNYLLSILIPHSKLNPKVIILGNQKTGTTAIAGLLAKSVGASVMLDFPDMYPHLQKFYSDNQSFEQFVKSYRFCFSHEIVKEPNLTFLYSELRQYFPNAQFVFVIRDPRDNIRSILNRVHVQGDLNSLPLNKENRMINSVWKSILIGEWFSEPASANYIEHLANRWVAATAVYENAHQSMLLARYEDFLEDKVDFIYSLAAQLGMEPKHDISGLADFQFQPIGNRQVRWDSFFGNQNLSKIEQICGAKMVKFDYPFSMDEHTVMLQSSGGNEENRQ